MIKHEVPNDVFCDKGNGEFRLLSPAEVLFLYGEIKNAFSKSQAILDEAVYSVSTVSQLASWDMTFMRFVDDVQDEFIPVHERVTVHTLCLNKSSLQEVTTVVIEEQADVAHTMLHHDFEDLYTTTVEYVTSPCSERYVFSIDNAGVCDGRVEQYDLMHDNGDPVWRPLTIYDGERVLSQVEGAVERTAAGMLY